MTRKITMLAHCLCARVGLAGLVLLLGLPSCRTLTLDMEKSGTLPRVEIEGCLHQEVVDSCDEVLSKHGYKFVRQARGRRLYEKNASRMDYLAWGGWSSSEDELMERLSVTVREAGADAYEVECQPFLVTDADGYMEEARKITRLKSGKYQKLLEEMKEHCGQIRDDYEGFEWD